MLDPCLAVALRQHAHDVEADFLRPYPRIGEPLRGKAAHATDLGRDDGFHRLPEAPAAPGLDLDEDERVAIAHDDVDLARLAAPVAIEHRHALADEIARR